MLLAAAAAGGKLFAVLWAVLKKVCPVVGLRNLFCLSEKQERSDPGEIFSGCGVQMRHLIRAVDAISAFFFAAVCLGAEGGPVVSKSRSQTV